MKYMKLGSKPDCFQTDGRNIRYVANELETDIVVSVGEVKFYLHKFPILSKSARLQKLVAASNSESSDELDLSDIPGGPSAFETCAKFCYSMVVALNAYNVVAARCAAEFLEMYETIDKGNLIYKIEVFLDTSIFRSWKDSIIVLQSAKYLSPLSEHLKIVSRSIESIASKASIDPSKVDWSYTYDRRKLPEENGNLSRRTVPRDWWVEDLCELEFDMYKQVIMCVASKGMVSKRVIGQALKAYAYRKIPGFNQSVVKDGNPVEIRSVVEIILTLLPLEKGAVSCSFLLKLLKTSIRVNSSECTQAELIRRTGKQLDEASPSDLLIHAADVGRGMYDVDVVYKLVEEFRSQGWIPESDEPNETSLGMEILSDASKLMVTKLIDAYLAEIAKDSKLDLGKFIDIAKAVSSFPRPSHDALYRAIDMYLKEHPGMTKTDRKKICRLMDCKKLSSDACTHAVQNDRLPLRVIVQVLFFEQVRASASSGSSTPDLPKAIIELNNSIGSNGSSKSLTTNTEDDWDALASSEELKALKGEIASLSVLDGSRGESERNMGEGGKVSVTKAKGLIVSKKLFSRIWSSKRRQAENSSSEPSECGGPPVQGEAKSTPSRSGRHSVS